MEINFDWFASATTTLDLDPHDYLEYDTKEDVQNAILEDLEMPSFPYLGDDMEAYIDSFDKINSDDLEQFLSEWEALKQNECGN